MLSAVNVTVGVPLTVSSLGWSTPLAQRPLSYQFAYAPVATDPTAASPLQLTAFGSSTSENILLPPGSHRVFVFVRDRFGILAFDSKLVTVSTPTASAVAGLATSLAREALRAAVNLGNVDKGRQYLDVSTSVLNGATRTLALSFFLSFFHLCFVVLQIFLHICCLLVFLICVAQRPTHLRYERVSSATCRRC